jgi:hypothetical protein
VRWLGKAHGGRALPILQWTWDGADRCAEVMRKKEGKKDEIVNADGCESSRTRGDSDEHFTLSPIRTQ